MNASTTQVGAVLSDEQVKAVLSLAEKIEKVASRLNLSLRDYAQVPEEPVLDSPMHLTDCSLK